jgi:hypothetical protein
MIWLIKLRKREPNNNFEAGITDLTTLGQHRYEREPKLYLCEFCDVPLIEKRDDITYLGTGNHRYICPRCAATSDLTPDGISRIKAAEAPHVIVGDDIQDSTITPQIELVENSRNINKTRGTLFMRDVNDIDSLDPEPREEEELRAQGAKILKKTIKRADGRSISVTYDDNINKHRRL